MADQNGFNSFYLNAGMALGGRTDLFATYRETLATTLTQAQDLLATTTVDALGNPVDSQSGAPVVLINPFLGLSDTLYRMRVGTVSLRYQWPRDVLTLSGTWQSQEPITSAINAGPVSTTPRNLCDFKLGARLLAAHHRGGDGAVWALRLPARHPASGNPASGNPARVTRIPMLWRRR